MPETPELTYAALITIALPGQDTAVSMTVTLSPADLVVLDGQAKPLRDCTLADLRRYAAELEAEVWQTYEQITLPDLDADEQVDLLVTRLGQEAQPLEDWTAQALILPPAELVAELAEALETEAIAAEAETGAGVEPEGAAVTAATVEAVAAERPALPESTPEVESSDLPDLAVADSELVFPEIEDEISGEPAEVIPSQARVRVAGQRLPVGDPTWAAVDILIDEPALRAAQAHALSSLNREVAGVLIGRRPEKQPDGRYLVHVFDTIVAKHTVMQGASVTYTPESWRYLNDTLNERYPDDTAVMVGWYHTHPGFGIFLSGMDLFIHQNFFTQIWHVAMVLDPQARTSGFFCWDRAKSRVGRHDFVWPAWADGSW